jgi:hypothetical protein
LGSKFGSITWQLTQTFGGPAVGILRQFGGDKHARFMLRMRLSFDCCYDAVATQGANNLFAVESLANANKRRITRKRKGATENQHVSQSSLPVRASAPDPEALEYLS